ncbi:hypothetical protein [Tsukamurella pseudospumae]|uniref:Uncharacterized protein n=1 Tax=Tsukamurella pseudospumae TaxID=239498 RepID=A0A138ATX8_9ACTN|nr:hypothetical protein [Tsukamurella pseudospumae]KXP13898.1 hypothetical protein AXK60_22605 [Tsukamurella pseudospumae]
MASPKAAKFHANLTRELFVLQAVVAAGPPPDLDELVDEAIERDSGEVSDDITELQRRIKFVRDAHPITRWVDADPDYRDKQSPWTNNH